jgi:hypothetical protein
MHLSPQDASAALDAIDSAERRARERIGYREASRYLILWGLVWFCANAAGALLPASGQLAWPVAATLGVLINFVMIFLHMRRLADVEQSAATRRTVAGRRIFMLGITMGACFPAMFTVLGELAGRQVNAFIPLFWAFVGGGALLLAGFWLRKT